MSNLFHKRGHNLTRVEILRKVLQFTPTLKFKYKDDWDNLVRSTFLEQANKTGMLWIVLKGMYATKIQDVTEIGNEHKQGINGSSSKLHISRYLPAVIQASK